LISHPTVETSPSSSSPSTQVKDEQFDYLYASIKARNEQYFEYKRAEDEQLRARLQQLDLENDQLQVLDSPDPFPLDPFALSHSHSLSPHLCHPLLRQNQLRTATRKLNILTWKTASKNSPFSNLPDDLTTYIISYLSPIDLVKALTLSWASFIHRADSCAQVITRIPWVEEGDYGKNYFFENGVIMR
jgi:hypothetical protein